MNDHYVSQTYLGNFTNSDGYLIPYYKADYAVLGSPKLPKAVCYEVDGDSNKYFEDPRILDLYLQQFENPWKHNIESIREHALDSVMKYQIAGYVAFLRVCTPTAKRMGQAIIKAIDHAEVDNISKRSFEEHPPKDEETRDIIRRSIEQKGVRAEVDGQFPHALGISSLLQSTARYYYGEWLVLINESDQSFVTSDNPAVAYYHMNDHSRASVYVPISPDIAILMNADLNDRQIEYPLRRGSFFPSDRFAVPKTKYVEVFNDLIIKAAEQRVFSNTIESWLEAKVRAFKDWRMDTVIDELPHDGGTLFLTRQLVRKIERA
ncbi:MAG: DUF4238 domain-containing protein [Planctomycetes bacterium]|nr:DUF4238 domain-containing protein [Planctomycetota bacterium]